MKKKNNKMEQYQKLLDYALKLLSFRPRSCQEIDGKLAYYSAKKNIPPDLVNKVIDDLKSQNLINDEEFALWWKNQRTQFKPKGKYAIKMELLQKGIPKEIIEKILSEGNNSGNQEFEMAQKLALKKIPSYRNLSLKEKKIKIGNFLYRRGFSWEIIRRVIDSVL